MFLSFKIIYKKLRIFAVGEKEDEEETDADIECTNSLYASFDPFDYMYSPSECSQHSDPIYAAVIKTQTPVNSPPPLPPRNSNSPGNFNVSCTMDFNHKILLSLVWCKGSQGFVVAGPLMETEIGYRGFWAPNFGLYNP